MNNQPAARLKTLEAQINDRQDLVSLEMLEDVERNNTVNLAFLVLQKRDEIAAHDILESTLASQGHLLLTEIYAEALMVAFAHQVKQQRAIPAAQIEDTSRLVTRKEWQQIQTMSVHLLLDGG
jgi:hypothetical protein